MLLDDALSLEIVIVRFGRSFLDFHTFWACIERSTVLDQTFDLQRIKCLIIVSNVRW
jgi:hypothetical protein